MINNPPGTDAAGASLPGGARDSVRPAQPEGSGPSRVAGEIPPESVAVSNARFTDTDF